MASSRGLKATEMIIKHFEKIDAPEEDSKDKLKEEENFDDITLFDVSKDETTDMSACAGESSSTFDDSFNMDEFGKL